MSNYDDLDLEGIGWGADDYFDDSIPSGALTESLEAAFDLLILDSANQICDRREWQRANDPLGITLWIWSAAEDFMIRVLDTFTRAVA